MKTEREDLLATIGKLAGAGSPPEQVLNAICHLLKEVVEHYDWVGIYLADPDSRVLDLGPYAGEPTEHVRIPYGKGICGQAAERLDTFVVQDVAAEGNYLACNPLVRSEVVLPILDGDGRFLGELDIDSHEKAPFTPGDREFLAAVCGIISPLMAEIVRA